MTDTASPDQAGPEALTGDETFDAYTAAFEAGEAPLLGHLVLYSIFDAEVTRDQLDAWFKELGLDRDLLPAEQRNVDAFERATGPDVKTTYALDAGPAGSYRAGVGNLRRGGSGRSAVLMIRAVRRDGGMIVRHLVREVRDAVNTSLTYDTHLAKLMFHRNNDSGTEGDGILTVEPDDTAIQELPAEEQATVRALIGNIESRYQRHCRYLTADKMRAVVRNYLEALQAIRVRKTGGVYFVHQQHSDTLAALRTLVTRYGERSSLTRIPLPDQDEMREMVIAAFTSKAKDDLDKLAADIAAMQRDGQTATNKIDKLHHRFAELRNATEAHAALLSTSLDDTNASLDLVKLQLGALLAGATGDNGEPGE